MTEADWWSCDDPGLMLDHIESRASDRKLRLFAVPDRGKLRLLS
jgi:hypothetical protein